MWLPVMDNRNKSIVNPTSREISDARMRCLVKAIALHGLGLYIYAGEDLPEAVKEERNAVLTPAQLEEINKQLDDVQANKEAFCKLFKIGSLAEMKQSDLDKACDMIEHKRKSLEASNAKS
jgi:DNA polymerase III alpha subunit